MISQKLSQRNACLELLVCSFFTQFCHSVLLCSHFKPTDSFAPPPEPICEDLYLAVVSVDRRSVWKWGEQVCHGEKTLNALMRHAAWRLSHNLSEVIMHQRDEKFGLSAQADQTTSLFCRFHGYSLNRKRQKLCIFIHKKRCPGLYPWARGNRTLTEKVSSVMEMMFYPSHSTGEFLQPPVASPGLQEGS